MKNQYSSEVDVLMITLQCMCDVGLLATILWMIKLHPVQESFTCMVPQRPVPFALQDPVGDTDVFII